MKNLTDFKLKQSKKKNNPSSGKVKMKLLIAFTFVIIALIFTQLVFSNNLAVDGQKLSQIEAEIKSLESENNNLRVEIAKESSFSYLSEKAQDLGFNEFSQFTSSI